MSSIFDSVDIATSRRKTKILEISQSRSLFSADTQNLNNNATYSEKPSEVTQSHLVDIKDPLTPVFLAVQPPLNPKVDIVWTLCIFFSLLPVVYSMYKTLGTTTFTIKMLVIPYDCSLLYLGIFCALPAATVHIFCLSLIFNKSCKIGIVLAIASIFIMVITVEQACMLEPQVSVNNTFYMFSFSTYLGLVSQFLFVSILYKQSPYRSMYTCILGFAGVLVTLSILAIVLSALNSEIPHTKSTVLVRTLPLSAAIIIHVVSTYWTIYPVRIVCNNM